MKNILPGGPAHCAGIKELDIITHVDGERVNDFNDLSAILEKHKPGNQVKIVLDRAGQSVTIDLVLGEMPRG